jgi:uncharacterized repeat protein (TIGR03803 family)
LQLTNLQVSQSGAYSVVVTNAHGAATSSPALLTVIACPPPTYTVLHNFTGSDGGGLSSSLVLSGGTLYGTTDNGGLHNCGTVFKVNTDGSGFALLKSFSGGNDGSGPCYGVVLSGATLYGTTWGDGTLAHSGTVFKMSTNGSGYSVLWQFSGSDGRSPECSLLLSSSTLFGTTYMGGSSDYGTVFKIGTDGSGFTVLKQFAGSDGAHSTSGLVLSGTTLYGTTYTGVGGSWPGVVFGINTGGSGYTVLKGFTGDDGAGASGRFVLSGAVL